MKCLSTDSVQGVILPTCWDYMESLHSDKWLYGLTLAAMSISNLFVGPVMGGIYDRTHQTKLIAVVLILFLIGGEYMFYSTLPAAIYSFFINC